MKIDVDDLNKTYDKCIAFGNIKEKAVVDTELIMSIKNMAEMGISFIKKQSDNLEKNSEEWTFVFRDYYEALRNLIEAFLLFDKIDCNNHQCKNAYICLKHPELDMDWNFLETVRLKRNAINYKGQMLNYKDWNRFKLQFDLHIKMLKEEIEKKLE